MNHHKGLAEAGHLALDVRFARRQADRGCGANLPETAWQLLHKTNLTYIQPCHSREKGSGDYSGGYEEFLESGGPAR